MGLGVLIGIVAAKGSNPTGLLDLHIYRDAARGISRGAFYDYQDPNFGLGFTYPPFAAVLFADPRTASRARPRIRLDDPLRHELAGGDGVPLETLRPRSGAAMGS